MTKEDLTKEVSKNLLKVKEIIQAHEWSRRNPEHNTIWEQMVKNAQELHKLVKAKHHDYMIKNRGCNPDEPEFYNHIHPIEDLLAFIENPTANDNQKDITIDDEFDFKIYSNRWEHDDTYKLKRIENGWHVDYLYINGECNKNGKPYLFANLKQDQVNYPVNLSSYIYSLWNKAANDGLNHNEVQQYLNEISDWVSKCEKSIPLSLKGL